MSNLKDVTTMRGWTEVRLFDREKLYKLISERVVMPDFRADMSVNEMLMLAKESGIREKYLMFLLSLSAKPLFNVNALWKLVKKFTGKDLKIPFLLGMWTNKALSFGDQPSIVPNTVTTLGKKVAAQQFGGTTTAPVTAIAIGIGSPSASALGSEITTNGGERGASTVSNQTTSLTGDTEQFIKTFTFTGSFAITEEALFDNNTSGGNMACSQSFSAINVVSTDTLQITHKVQFA